MKTSKLDKIILALILITAVVLRLWRFPSYSPLFWDEAKYLAEIEGIVPYFSVNVGTFTFLRLGYTVIGTPSYPQIVTALFGFLTVLGCYFLGKRTLRGSPAGVYLGLMMAGHAAVMPYFILYSRHALATIFALCFLVYALYFYLAKLQHARIKNAMVQRSHLRTGIIAAGLLALVPACSFKFFLPTIIIFVLMEILIWRVRSPKRREYGQNRNLIISLIAGVAFFLIMPLFLAAASGYTGWMERALELTKSHASIQTMRMAFHFLYPIHIYHLCGIPLIFCLLIGSILLLVGSASKDKSFPGKNESLILFIPFAVYLLFFGSLSHLQSARLYGLTLVFAAYGSSVFLLRLHNIKTRIGNLVFVVIGCLLFGSMGYISLDYLSKTSNLNLASDIVTQNIKPGRIIYSNAKPPLGYCIHHSKYNRRISFRVNSFASKSELELDTENPPLVVIHDGVDLVSMVASLDKYDNLAEIDSVKRTFDGFRFIGDVADRAFVAAEDFYTSPYYYLEDIYSWRSYRYVRKLMPQARDSLFVYVVH